MSFQDENQGGQTGETVPRLFKEGGIGRDRRPTNKEAEYGDGRQM